MITVMGKFPERMWKTGEFARSVVSKGLGALAGSILMRAAIS